jgi:hypothetical protein
MIVKKILLDEVKAQHLEQVKSKHLQTLIHYDVNAINQVVL